MSKHVINMCQLKFSKLLFNINIILDYVTKKIKKVKLCK